jgi:preprotein translocase subunit SecG
VIFTILQIIVAVLLIGVILLQAQGSGLSASFGGSGESFRSRRSIEKFLLYATVILAALFALLSIILLIIR